MAAGKYTTDKISLPRISAARLAQTTAAASTEADVDLDRKLLVSPAFPAIAAATFKEETRQALLTTEKSPQTVLYLAYGSNLASSTFRGRRGIKPIAQINVYVPELKLTFDLAGVPYIEPCFAGSRYRTEADRDTKTRHDGHGEEIEKVDISSSSSLLNAESTSQHRTDYHKDRWHKPLIGVVYEVTLKDYAHIIATEGGGNGYRDVSVTCYPFPDDYDATKPTPTDRDGLTTTPFMARTLLSPWVPDNTHNDPRMRPGPSYAQPSARYLRLLMTGAEELDFPTDYRQYLAEIRPYRITTWRQAIGRTLFLARWLPPLLLLLALQRVFVDDRGIMHPWLARWQSRVFKALWTSYDTSFRGVFGDGERTIGDV